MICTTIRNGMDCPFMTAKGCGYKGGVCLAIAEACSGCGRSQEFATGWYCTSCPDPSIKWKNGNCNLATHIVIEPVAAKAKVNPLKASKRAAGK